MSEYSKQLTREVLVEKTNALYPLRKNEIVKNNWKEGQHPRSCIGNCKIQPGVFGGYCDSCGWHDY